MTTALFLLRCCEIGLSMADLDMLTVGTVIDLFTERGRDSDHGNEAITADQNMMDAF